MSSKIEEVVNEPQSPEVELDASLDSIDNEGYYNRLDKEVNVAEEPSRKQKRSRS